MDAGEIVARDVVVHGLVQGVAFRWTTRVEAERLGVTGWVRNEYDGTVRAHLEGDPRSVADLVTWLGHGPSGARVDRCDTWPGEVQGHRAFAVG